MKSSPTQQALDMQMYDAFRKQNLPAFKQALHDGANPDAHYEDAFFKGEHLIAQMMKGDHLDFLVPLLEAGASFDLVKREEMTVLSTAAIHDFNANGPNAHPSKHSALERQRLDLLFAAGAKFTDMDRMLVQQHRRSDRQGDTLSYAEQVDREAGQLQDEQLAHVLRPTPESILIDHHLAFDRVKRDANLFRLHPPPPQTAPPVPRVTSVTHHAPEVGNDATIQR